MDYEQVAELIRRHEGLRLKPYKCPAGKITIGYGRNLVDNGITESEAEMLLATDIQNAYAEVSKFTFFSRLNLDRQAVLVDMAFNLGITRLKQFKKMIAALERADYKTAAKEALDSTWARQTGTRAKELAHILEIGEI